MDSFWIQYAEISYYHLTSWESLWTGSFVLLASLSFTEHFKVFCHHKISQAYLVLSLTWLVIPFGREWYLENKIWKVGVPVVAGVLLL